MGKDIAMTTPVAALHTAAYNGDLETVKRLIDEGVDVNVWDKWGCTALSFASGNGHLEVVELLLDHGAWVNPHEDYDTYETPLFAAASYGHFEVVKLLVARGADPRLHVWISQSTPDNYADAKGHTKIADYLRQLIDKANQSEGGRK